MPAMSSPLPFLSADLPPLGGRLKDEPGHFVVEELPLYLPCGEGGHLYLNLRRAGQSTMEVVAELSRRFGVPPAEIGYAGLKDKQAVATQSFSLAVRSSEADARLLLAGAPFEIISISRHKNKLKVGHLVGNRFGLILSEPRGTLSEAQSAADFIKIHGAPNYFGEQRFGRDGDNAEAGLKFLKSGQRAKGRRDKFILSALQSFIFNVYLGKRIEAGLFEKVMTGDICKKTETGGLFISEDGALETERLLAGELSHTGPLFGRDLKEPLGDAAEFEAEILRGLNLTKEELRGAGAGDRRAGRLLLPDLTVREDVRGLAFEFSLPKGAYATSVMREFMKTEFL